jgi:DNA-binding protein H-NS
MPDVIGSPSVAGPKMQSLGPCFLQIGLNFCCKNLSTEAFDIEEITPQRREQMAKLNGIDKMTYAELAQLRTQIDRLMVEKQNAERVALRQKLADMAKEHGLSLEEVLGKGRKGKGSVAPKYRDPKNPDNTWTGRGRMPRWMVAATRGGKSSKDDFLI